MSLWLIIGIGGFIGSIFRYCLSGWIQGNLASFPLGTLGVNFLGSFVLSLILYVSEYKGIFEEETRIFWSIGILGSFTTMSTFSFETFKLFEEEQMMLAWLNVTGTLILTLIGIYLGKFCALRF